MELKINIVMKNAAFEDRGDPYEVARILRELADCIESRLELEHVLRDVNGNRIGQSKIEGGHGKTIGE